MPYILKAGKLETQENKVTTLNNEVTDEQYPSAKAVHDAITNSSSGYILTETDKQEIVDLVIDSLQKWEGGSY